MLLRIINLNASWKLSSWAPLCRTECRPSRVWLSVSHKSKFPLQPEEGRKKRKKSRAIADLYLLHTQSFSCIIQISTKMRLRRRDHATISTFSWFLRFMGKGQQKTTGAPSQETEKNHSKLLQTWNCFLIACQCIGLRDEQLSRDHLGRLRKCQPSLAKTHETQFKPDW